MVGALTGTMKHKKDKMLTATHQENLRVNLSIGRCFASALKVYTDSGERNEKIAKAHRRKMYLKCQTVPCNWYKPQKMAFLDLKPLHYFQ